MSYVASLKNHDGLKYDLRYDLVIFRFIYVHKGGGGGRYLCT